MVRDETEREVAYSPDFILKGVNKPWMVPPGVTKISEIEDEQYLNVAAPVSQS